MPTKSWADFLETLEPCEALISESWMAEDPQFQVEYRRQLATNLSIGYFLYFQADPDHPDWTPLFNQAHTAQPNPDDTYYWSPVKGDGIYRLYGERGNVHMLMFSISCGLIGMSEPPGPALGTYDLRDFKISSDGTFEIVCSGKRPAGYGGNWIRLDPQAEYITVRQRHYDWAKETGTRIAIEALHEPGPKPRMSIEETERRLHELALFTQRFSRVFFNYHAELRSQGLINRVGTTDFGEMGGLQAKQVYWQGIFEFGKGEAILIETELPESVGYWNVQVNDLLFNAIDYVYHQSSLNGVQAKLSSDGRFRAVISVDDPGVSNWLDTSDHYEGVLVGRWTDASSAPTPTLTRVSLSRISSLMPADTPVVTPGQRAATLRERVRGHQFRRRW